MFHTPLASKSFINRAEYRDKVLGCWAGKNIGGTLGAPFEGKKETHNLTFYAQKLDGNPAPNDDLDLQLAWLLAVEEHGLYNVNELVLGEYWLDVVCGPWNEYGVAKFNMRNGFTPPLSGLCNNEKWQNSNGAWIRSEIWACLFPGDPEEAVHYAWYDSCVDHTGEGIYAEIFTVAMESAAFIEKDIRKIISCALCRIPENCRVAQSVKLVIDCYDNGDDWLTAREKVVQLNADMGWFQAPGNVAFVIIGLLYGEGDFGKSICTAVNCGDDTDCTGATCGAILGIINGRSAIPQEWMDPIGESIQTVAVNRYGNDIPVTLQALTDRVMICKDIADTVNPATVRVHDKATVIDQKHLDKLCDRFDTENFVLSRPSNQLRCDLPFGRVYVQYEPSPVVNPNSQIKLKISFGSARNNCCTLSVNWHLPESWSFEGAQSHKIMTYPGTCKCIELTLNVGEFSDVFEYIPVELRLAERNYPVYITVPFQCSSMSDINAGIAYQDMWTTKNRISARINDLCDKPEK